MNKNISYLLNKLLQSVVALLGLISAHDSYAVPCSPLDSGPFIRTYQPDLKSIENYVGYETPWIHVEFYRKYFRLKPPCLAEAGPTFFTFTPNPDLIRGSSTSGAVWYDMPENDYLQIAVQVFIGGLLADYVNWPVVSRSNQCAYQVCWTDLYTTGVQYYFKFRVKKKFVGEIPIYDRVVANLYAATDPNSRPTDVIGKILLGGRVISPQSCSFNPGTVAEFDFGKISSNAFSGVGAGNRAQDVKPITKTIGIECQSVDAQQMLSARVESTNPNNNIVVSDNPDVGFQIADKDERILKPNDITSFIPFQLDENGRSDLILKAWPVSVTGNKPVAGPVNAAGYIHIDFR